MEKGARYRPPHRQCSASFPFFFFPGGGIITEFIWLQVSHWKTWVFISVQPDASITKRAGILFIIKNVSYVRLICLIRRSSWATPRHLAILQQGGEKAAGNESNSVLLLVDGIRRSGGKNRKNPFFDVFSFIRKKYEDGLTTMCVQIFWWFCNYIHVYVHI